MRKIKIRNLIVAIFIIIIFSFIPVKVYGVTIALDAGHGGNDTGAVSGKIYEKTINLKVTQYLKKYLEEYENTNIIMTRSNDTFLEIYDRAMIARNKKVDLLISLHFNSAETTTTYGAEVYVSKNTSLDKYNKETTILGNKILEKLEELGINNRGVRTRLIPTDETDIYSDGTRADYYGIIRYAMRGCKIDSGIIKPEGTIPAKVEAGEGIPAIIIEHCYMNNSNDYAFIDSDTDLQKLARADANAIVEYYNLKKKSNERKSFKIKEQLIVTEPDTTMQRIQEKYITAKYVTSEEKIATGVKISIENVEYKIVKLGDCNGDGSITPADYVKVKNNIMQVSKLIGENEIAADVNEDGNITPADYVKIKNHIMNVSKIQIKVEE